jgi:ABC-2 type transport system ATP-binding protein
LLKITDLRKSYKKFEVLKGLNMNLSKGEIYGFLGKNGCGKTTTMNIICNIIAKDSGKIEFVGRGNPDTPNHRSKIGYLTESPALYGFMNGYEYLRYISACSNYQGDTRSREARINEVLEITGMQSGARRRIKGYSRGMNQRLGIAAAMLDNPELLILDEPTSALDPEGRMEVMNIIRSLKSSGTTVILCSHIITDVERIADKIGIMKDGVIACEGSIDEVMNKYKSQSTEISVRLSMTGIQASQATQAASEMAMLPSVNASRYNQVSGLVTLGSLAPDVLYDEIISFIYERKIRISELVSQKTTLEDIYFAITGHGGRA